MSSGNIQRPLPQGAGRPGPPVLGAVSLVAPHSGTVQRDTGGVQQGRVDLDYCDIEQFAWEMNRDHSVIIEIAFKEMVKLLPAMWETRV